MPKQSRHWPDNTMYFLTGSAFTHYPYFRDDEQKMILLNQIKKIQEKLGIPVSAYSIAMAHYHLEFFLERGLDLAKVKQIMHGGTSFIYRQRYKMKHEELWQSSRTLIVPNQEANLKITGYIAGNLIKHKEVSTFHELYDNQFSSFKYLVDKYGEVFAKELVREVIDVGESADGWVDVKDFESVSARLKPLLSLS